MENQDMNPWLSIWVRPKQTMRAIVDSNPNAMIWVLSAIYGLHYMFYLSQFFSFGKMMPLWGIVLLAIVLAIPAGYIVFSLSGFFLWIFGKLLGGHGPYTHVRSALAWGSFPNIVNVVLWVIMFITFGDTLFLHGFPASLPAAHVTLLQVCLLIQTVIFFWSLVIIVNGLGEVQGYSVWMGLLNVILASIVMGLIFYGVGFIVERL